MFSRVEHRILAIPSSAMAQKPSPDDPPDATRRSALDASLSSAQNKNSSPRGDSCCHTYFCCSRSRSGSSPTPWPSRPSVRLFCSSAHAHRRRLWIPLVLLAASDVVLTTLVYKYPFSW